MTVNTVDTRAALEFLGRVRELRRMIESKERRIETLRELATGTTAKVSDMPRSDSPNLQRMEAAICKAADLEREIPGDRAAMECARDEITAAICELADYREQQVLFHRYVECLRWPDVAVACGCHIRTAHRYHNDGVVNMAGIVEKKLSLRGHHDNT